MAKALLFLRAKGGNKAALLAAVAQEISTNYQQSSELPIRLRLLSAVDEDPLAKADAPLTTADVTIEIIAAAGQPLTPALASWSGLAERLEQWLEAEESIALVVHEQVFRPCEPQPICYYYLMQRRSDFSPSDYLDYYTHHHFHFGMITPGIEGYSQGYVDSHSSKVLAAQTGLGFRDVTSISEMHIASIDTFVNSGAFEEVGPSAHADEKTFVDQAASVMFSTELVETLGA